MNREVSDIINGIKGDLELSNSSDASFEGFGAIEIMNNPDGDSHVNSSSSDKNSEVKDTEYTEGGAGEDDNGTEGEGSDSNRPSDECEDERYET